MKSILTILFISMKTMTAILLFSCLSLAGQNCPPGKSWMPSISSDRVVIIADTCLPDADVESYWKSYFISLCGEQKLTQYSSYYRIWSGETWINDSIGCENRTVYEKKISGVWTQVSKCLWYWDNKSRFKCYGGMNRNIQIPCCGHFHKTKPK